MSFNGGSYCSTFMVPTAVSSGDLPALAGRCSCDPALGDSCDKRKNEITVVSICGTAKVSALDTVTHPEST